MPSHTVIENYFAAMRRGSQAEDDLVGLFAENAVYDEPFTSEPPAVGIDQIRKRFRLGWETPLPDLELDVLEVEIEGPSCRSRWECRSPALPGPIQGEDHYEIVDGKIARLVVTISES
ncbi:MAG: nuclear transport factor 2 family protein [Acidimicrobiia bacterium]